MRRALNWLLVASFIGIIAAPPVANLLGSDGADAVAENRTFAPFPALSPSLADVRTFLPRLDAWFADHFAFRSTLVRWYGISRYFWLGVSPSSAVAPSRDGWLFYVEDGGLEDFTNENLLTEHELQRWRDTIVRAQKWCRARGISFAFTIAPDKGSIYPELFPQTARRVSRLSRTDQIMTAITDTGAAIDVRQALMDGKRHVRLFQKTDTHWNQRGAYIAYRTIIDRLRLQVPAIPPPRELSDFNLVTRHVMGMDLAGMMGLKRVLGEEDLRLVPKQPRTYVVREPKWNIVEAGEPRIVTEIPGSTLPRAVIFRDSFMSALAPYLSEHFSRVVYVWRNDFAVDDIEAEHPDVVLQELVSRHIQWIDPWPELIPVP
jgi:alginate O-acetyltransferase complex protein AlgJ